MFQTSEFCIKLHAVVVLELLLSEQCPLFQVCVCVFVSTAPGVCALGWVKYREHISLLVILCIIMYVTVTGWKEHMTRRAQIKAPEGGFY